MVVEKIVTSATTAINQTTTIQIPEFEFAATITMEYAIRAGGFSALTLTKNPYTAPIPIPNPIFKLNGGPIRSPLKLKSENRKHRGWRITAGQSSSSSSISNVSGTKSVGLYEDLANSLAEAEVFDLSGNMVRLTDLWKERKAVVGFARHFGCVLCRKRADILASQEGYFNAAGVALVLIGPGSIEQAKAFIDQTKFPGEVYADPNHSAYDALKFVSGVSTTFTPSAGRKIIELYLNGYRQDWGLSFQKDTVSRGGWQQGGILVAGPGENNIIYLHKDKEAGDDPNIHDILKACGTS